MLTELQNLFKDGFKYTHVAGLLQQMANLVSILNNDFMKEPTGKNAAIDALCLMLQSHKDQPVECGKTCEGQNAPN